MSRATVAIAVIVKTEQVPRCPLERPGCSASLRGDCIFDCIMIKEIR